MNESDSRGTKKNTPEKTGLIDKTNPQMHELLALLEEAMVPHYAAQQQKAQRELRERAEAERQRAEAERQIRAELQQVVDKLLEIFNQKPVDKVTDSGLGRYGLADYDFGARGVRLSILKEETDHIGYFRYNIMDLFGYFGVDAKGNITYVRITDTQAMQEDDAPESHHYKYSTDWEFPKDGSLPQNAEELVLRIQPLLDAYDWPLSTNPALNKHHRKEPAHAS